MPIFCVKSVKIYTGPKKFTRIYSWRSWQIWGMHNVHCTWDPFIFRPVLSAPLTSQCFCICSKRVKLDKNWAINANKMTETTICQQFSKVFSLSQSGRGQKGERGPMGPRVSKKPSNLLWLQLTSSCYAPHNYKHLLWKVLLILDLTRAPLENRSVVLKVCSSWWLFGTKAKTKTR